VGLWLRGWREPRARTGFITKALLLGSRYTSNDTALPKSMLLLEGDGTYPLTPEDIETNFTALFCDFQNPSQIWAAFSPLGILTGVS